MCIRDSYRTVPNAPQGEGKGEGKGEDEGEGEEKGDFLRKYAFSDMHRGIIFLCVAPGNFHKELCATLFGFRVALRKQLCYNGTKPTKECYTMDQEKIAERIRLARKDAGMTLQEIATAIGVTKSTVQRYEPVSYTHLSADFGVLAYIA